MKKKAKAQPNSKALFTKMCAEIEKECHAMLDQAAGGSTSAMFCVMSGPMEVLHYATFKVEEKLRKQLQVVRAAK